MSSPAELKQEHADWVEDMAMDMAVKYDFKVEQIAWLDDSELSLPRPPHQQQQQAREQQQQPEGEKVQAEPEKAAVAAAAAASS